MKWLSKIFMVIALAIGMLAVTPVMAQTEDYEVVTYINWTQSNSGYWTKYSGYWVYNDFDWAVSRSVETHGGFYIYDIWLYSQSYVYNADGSTEPLSTNVRDIRVYADSFLRSRCVNSIGVTFFNSTAPVTLRFKSKSKYPTIIIRWGSMRGL